MQHRQDIGTLAQAREAVARGAWDTAVDLLGRLGGDERHSPEALETSAVAAYGAGDFEGAVGAWEQLHAVHRDAGDHVAAARAAAMVAMYLMMDSGLMAPVRGWLARAERLLPGDSTPVHAAIAMVRTYERFMCGDMDAAGMWAERATRLGTRHDVGSAVALGRVAAARVRIFAGEVEPGLAALDEVAVVLLSGELDPLSTGMVWCELICAMQGLARYDRAEEWTSAMDRWRRDSAFGGIHGRCRVHRAEMLRLRGTCEEAEEEALRACEELRPWMRREFGWPLTELGTIRLRRGDIPGAEEAFVEAHHHAWDPNPGLARVRLAQGDTDAAVAMIRGALAHPVAMPSKERPPSGALRRVPLLEAQAEIAAAAGDATTARAAADELAEISGSFAGPALAAGAALAQGRAALVGGDLAGCVRHSERAVAGWTGIRVPFEAAVARTVLAEAYEALGNGPCAQLERRAAGAAFERIGARRWAMLVAGPAAREVIDITTTGGFGPPNVFVCEGDTRTVTFDGETVLLRNLKGLRYLELLLAEPHREFHALDLVATERGTGATRVGQPRDADLSPSDGGDAGVLIDDRARAAYRRRLADIDEDIDEADRRNDPERAALARLERGHLVRELARAVGFGGRARRSGSTAERARSSVTRTLRYAMARIAEHHPTLASHLEHTVRTGTYCSYAPDPANPVEWQV